ncbi:unnamed protein product [Rotaria sp. Silwood1]|nr:unnamed protein product [Rotaria sp. Silwood1]
MSIDELNDLKRNIGQFISINSFFSTTTESEVAEAYLGDGTQQIDLEQVLFVIDANPKVASTKPFADIRTLSQFPDESEILFMLGSIFRVNSVTQDGKHIWKINMSLYSDDDHNLRDVLEDMKKQNGNGETSFWALGRLLKTMGKLDLAEQYYLRFLQELSSTDPSLRSLYDDLSEIASQQGNYDKSVHWRQKSRELKEQAAESNGNNKGEIIRVICRLDELC